MVKWNGEMKWWKRGLFSKILGTISFWQNISFGGETLFFIGGNAIPAPWPSPSFHEQRFTAFTVFNI